MGTVITEAMIGQILAAERNFSMPAGSLTDNGQSYAVRGGRFRQRGELSGLELMKAGGRG